MPAVHAAAFLRCSSDRGTALERADAAAAKRGKFDLPTAVYKKTHSLHIGELSRRMRVPLSPTPSSPTHLGPTPGALRP